MNHTRKHRVVATVLGIATSMVTVSAHAAYPQTQPTQAGYGYQQPAYGQYGQYGYQQPTPQYGQYGQFAPQAGYPMVAQNAAELPAPADAAAQAPAAPTVGSGTYGAPYPATNGYHSATVGHESYTPAPAPAATNGHGYGAGCNCGPQAAPASYGAVGCDNGYGYGGYGGYSSCGYGSCGNDYGVSGYFNNAGCGRQWFVGVYGLYMERDDSTRIRTSIELDTTQVPSYPYYPPAGPSPAVIRVDNTDDIDFDFSGGAEIRFGSTFGASTCGGGVAGCGGNGSYCGSCNYSSGYGCGYGSNAGCCCSGPQPYAWEVGYWALDDDGNSSLRVDTIATPDTRMYSMIDYFGLEYDRDSGGGAYIYQPLPDYVGQTPPIPAPTPATDPIPVAFLTRTNFRAQNLELNFLRLPVVTGGASVCGIDCGGGYGGGSCYGCDPCGYGACGGCGFQPSFAMTGLCGVRYLRFDDDFFNAIQFADPSVPDPEYDGFYVGDPDTEIFHEINVDNHLTGFQLGCNMDYLVSCKWSLFCNSNFGIYGNHISHYQRVFTNGAGNIRFVTDGADATVRTTKDDVSFLGELRAGAGYQVSCNCRLTAAYRVLAISGVALSVDQIRPFDNAAVVGAIDSQQSLILHGLQAGAEFKY